MMTEKEIERMKKSLEKEAPEFAKAVEPVYQVLNWGWGIDNQIPNYDKILESVNRLIGSFCEGLNKYGDLKRYTCGSGGLEVFIEKNIDCGDPQYGIIMVIGTRFYDLFGDFKTTMPSKEDDEDG